MCNRHAGEWLSECRAQLWREGGGFCASSHEVGWTEEAEEVLQALHGAVEEAHDEAAARVEVGSAEAKRLGSCSRFLAAEIGELRAGRRMMGRRFSELLSSLLRQQLRLVLDHKSEDLLADLPRGRGFGYLCNVTSAAKVLSGALYGMAYFASVEEDPTIAQLLQMPQLEARNAVRSLPPEDFDDVLSLAEARAALHHLLSHPAAPSDGDWGWPRLQELLQMAEDTECPVCSHFLRLLDVPELRAELASPSRSVTWLVKLLDWKSPQMPVNQRTRSFVNPARA